LSSTSEYNDGESSWNEVRSDNTFQDNSWNKSGGNGSSAIFYQDDHNNIQNKDRKSVTKLIKYSGDILLGKLISHLKPIPFIFNEKWLIYYMYFCRNI
jgi:hypothetical protein